MSLINDDDEDKQRVALAKTIKSLDESWTQQLEIIRLQAKYTYARYTALKRQGFSVCEALQLCTRKVEL